MSDERARRAVLSAAEVAEFDRWQSPAVGPPPGGGSPVAVGDLEAIAQAAYDEAFAQGLEEGRAAGAEQATAEVHRLAALVDSLARPFEDLDEAVEEQLVRLAMVVARKIVRREMRTDPSHVIGVVRDALGVLPVAARDVRVHLHPDDAELVRRHLKPAEGERAWAVVENPVLTRGGCRIETETSRVDASIETRLATLLAAIVGDERSNETSDEGAA